jgi:hypothetical protein
MLSSGRGIEKSSSAKYRKFTLIFLIYSIGAAFKWNKNRVTYYIANYSPDLPKSQQRFWGFWEKIGFSSFFCYLREAIKKAYGQWLVGC